MWKGQCRCSHGGSRARALDRNGREGWRGARGTHQGWPKNLGGLLLHRVQLLVLNKTAIPLEGFAAHLALIGLLAGVHSLMLDGGYLLSEGLAALLTLVGLLPRMNPLMDDKK